MTQRHVLDARSFPLHGSRLIEASAPRWAGWMLPRVSRLSLMSRSQQGTAQRRKGEGKWLHGNSGQRHKALCDKNRRL